MNPYDQMTVEEIIDFFDPHSIGELKVLLYNTGKGTFSVKKGDRIAQLVVAQVYKLPGFTLDNIREDKGFGSTGL